MSPTESELRRDEKMEGIIYDMTPTPNSAMELLIVLSERACGVFDCF